MNDTDLNLAALYGADRLSEQEEIDFAKKLLQDPELIMQTITQAPEGPLVQPPEMLREVIFERIFPPIKADAFLRPFADRNAQAVVVTDPAGLVEWVSPAFTRMCGYTLEELRGHKAGKMLQGAETDPRSLEVLRTGIREGVEAKAQVVNYHKSGDAYEVEIQISPLHGQVGDLVGFIAVESLV